MRRRRAWPVAVALAVVCAVAALVALVLPGGPSVPGAVVVGFCSGLGSLVGLYVIRPRAARRLARRSRVECSLRVVEGEQPGLSRHWHSGVADVAPGELVWRRLLGGVRVLRRSPVLLAARPVDGEVVRTTGLREARVVLPGCDVVELVTPTARLECAVAPAQRGWLVQRLTPGAS